MKKNKVFLIALYLLFVLLLYSTSDADYIYFYWNSDNWFQQWCSETYWIYYSWSQVYKAVELSVDLDQLNANYSWKNNTSEVTSTNFFNITHTSPLLTWAYNNTYVRYYEWVSHKAMAFKWDTIVWSKKIWNLIFSPEYNLNNYTWYLVLIFDGNDVSNHNHDSVWLISDNINFIAKYYSGVQNNHLTGYVPVLRQPCAVTDSVNPKIKNWDVSYSSNSNDKHVDKKDLTFRITDAVSGWKTPYYYNSTWEWTWNWGINYYNSKEINDQLWIKTDTIKIKISWKWLDWHVDTNREIPLSSIVCTWDGSKTWTWWLDRDYDCSVDKDKLFTWEFWVEETITLTITWLDRAWKITNLYTKTFNQYENPELSNNSPKWENWSNWYPINSRIEFTLKDDWAGVNSGKIFVTISDGSETKVYTWNVSTSMVVTKITWEEWTGNWAWYRVVITPERYFPAATTISVTVEFEDLKWHDVTTWWTFRTRRSCAALWCCDWTEIYTWLENSYISFTWENLYISGGNNPSVTTWNIEYFWSIFTWALVINCNYVWLTLFKWVPGNAWEWVSVPYNRLVFSWSNNLVKWVLSWNVLILKYYVQDTNVQIDTPIEWSGLDGGYLVDSNNDYTTTWVFTWHLSDDTNSNEWLSGYDFVVYSGNVFGSDEVYSGRITSTGINREFTWNEYVWWVRAVDNEWNYSEWATGSFKIKYRLACEEVDLILVTPEYWTWFTSSRQVYFEWNLSGWQWIDNLTYGLYVWESGTSMIDAQAQTWITNTWYSLAIENNWEYKWRVIASDPYWHEIVSDSGYFTIDVNGLVTVLVVTPENISGDVVSIDENGNYQSGNLYMQWSTNENQVSWEWEFTWFDLTIYSWSCGDTSKASIWTYSTWKNVTGMLMPDNPHFDEWDYCWMIQAVVMSGNERKTTNETGLSFFVRNPYCVKSGNNLEILGPASEVYTENVTLEWSGSWDSCLVTENSGYFVELYSGNIWDTTDKKLSWSGKNTSTAVNLSAWQYRWRVRMVDNVEWEWKTWNFEVVAMLDPGQIVNTHFELVLVKPVSWSVFNDGNIEFEWYATWQWVWNLTYTLDIYTWEKDNISNSTHITWISAWSATGLNVDLWNWTYWWKVKVEDNYNNSGIASTGYFDVSLEQTYTVKVYPGGRAWKYWYADSGVIRVFRLWTEAVEVYSGYLSTSIWWTWLFTWMIPEWQYTIFYKWQSCLASYLSWVIIAWQTWFDFTTWDNLYWTYSISWVEYQKHWDLINWIWEIDHQVQAWDAWNINRFMKDYFELNPNATYVPDVPMYTMEDIDWNWDVTIDDLLLAFTFYNWANPIKDVFVWWFMDTVYWITWRSW